MKTLTLFDKLKPKKTGLKKKQLNLLLIATLIISSISYIGNKPGIAHAAAAPITISLKSTITNGNYVSSGKLGTTALTASSTSVWFGELFDLEDLGNGDFALKSRANKLYVSVNSSNALIASKSSTATSILTSAEKFKKTINSNNTISLNSNSTLKYVTVNLTTNQLTASQLTNTSNAEQFQISTPYDLNKTIRILEITESGSSDLNVDTVIGNTTNNIVVFETIKMKTFVALRGELDGKYDAIYIGKGIYNPTGVAPGVMNATGTDALHNTKALLNDITNLKANEIVNGYINKGLPVMFYSDQATNGGFLYQNKFADGSRGKLYTTFSTYNSLTPKSNVIFVSAADILSTTAFINKTNLLQNANIRPRINMTSKPIDYTADVNKIYFAGEDLTFTFNIGNVADITQRHLVAKLYMGIDYVLLFGADQLIATQPITSLTGNTLTFHLPKGYSGLHYWKLELVDLGNSLKDTETGLIRYKDQKTIINVLQVLPVNGDSSSLLKPTNLNQSYLETPDYKINITVKTITDFNTSDYLNLNGKYDMIIFGFTDSYNNSAEINALASAATKAFIKTGQSVMFTHDTIFNNGTTSNQNWLNYFQTATGQIAPWTNMGYGAPLTSTTTKKVNDGILTQFPFYIGSAGITPSVALTHDQYYTLDLENRNIIPWYNITGGTRDNDDSWNHYYTYSNGNVTYSGTGHTNTNFPDWEQKLFVNTMYRAFIGSNHAPTLEIYSPEAYSISANNIIPSTSNILVSFKPDDFDLVDRTLNTTIKYKINNSGNWVTWLAESERSSGEVITQNFANPLPISDYPFGGDLTIQISTTDKSFAIVTKEIVVKIVNVAANLDISRTVSANVIENQIEKNENVDITYTIAPKSIASATGIAASDLVIRGIKLQELFPADMDIITLPSIITGQNKTGSLATGFTLNGNLPDIQYRLNGTKFIADPIVFKITVKPSKNKNYLLNNSNLTFSDFKIGSLTPLSKTLPFTAFSLQGVTRVTSLTLDHADIAKGDNSKLIAKYAPFDATDFNFTWESSDPTIVSIDPISGNYIGVNQGTAQITVNATDGSGLIGTNTVTVIQPGINIIGQNSVYVKDTINLEGVFVSINENVTSSSWTVISGTDKVNLTNGAGPLNKVLEGLETGSATIQLDVSTLTAGTKLPRSYSTTLIVNVYNSVDSVSIDINGSDEVTVGSNINLTARITPSDGKNSGYTWTLLNPSTPPIASKSDSNNTTTLTGLLNGDVTVQVTVGGINGSVSRSVQKTIHVKPNFNITGPNKVNVGEQINLEGIFLPNTPNITSATWSITSGGTGTNKIIELTNDSSMLKKVITGLKKGSAAIELTVTTLTDISRDYTRSFTVTVSNPVTSVNIDSDFDEVAVGDTLKLTASITPYNGDNSGYTWTIVNPSNPAVASKVDSNKTTTLTGLTEGDITIMVSLGGINDEEPKTKTKIIHVRKPLNSISINNFDPIYVGDSITLNSNIAPGTIVDNSSYTWEMVGPTTVANITSTNIHQSSTDIKGLTAGTAEVQVSLLNVSATKPITVKWLITSLGFTSSSTNIQLKPDAALSLIDTNLLTIGTDLTDVSKRNGALIWSTSNSSIVSVTPNGEISGKKLGFADIRVTYKDRPLVTFAVIRVYVVNGDYY
ncbi:DUF5057 domain-containing protein [Paenibacillus psychroresistens]|nr:DUF5057 domain-containing protein [Paenibacillus psychroresistens]